MQDDLERHFPYFRVLHCHISPPVEYTTRYVNRPNPTDRLMHRCSLCFLVLDPLSDPRCQIRNLGFSGPRSNWIAAVRSSHYVQLDQHHYLPVAGLTATCVLNSRLRMERMKSDAF